MYLCVCVYVYIYIYIYIYVYTYMYIYIYTCVDIYVYIYIYTCTYTYIYIYIYACNNWFRSYISPSRPVAARRALGLAGLVVKRQKYNEQGCSPPWGNTCRAAQGRLAQLFSPSDRQGRSQGDSACGQMMRDLLLARTCKNIEIQHETQENEIKEQISIYVYRKRNIYIYIYIRYKMFTNMT